MKNSKTQIKKKQNYFGWAYKTAFEKKYSLRKTNVYKTTSNRKWLKTYGQINKKTRKLEKESKIFEMQRTRLNINIWNKQKNLINKAKQ